MALNFCGAICTKPNFSSLKIIKDKSTTIAQESALNFFTITSVAVKTLLAADITYFNFQNPYLQCVSTKFYVKSNETPYILYSIRVLTRNFTLSCSNRFDSMSLMISMYDLVHEVMKLIISSSISYVGS